MDLLADENIPGPVIRRLRSDGWNVSAIIDFAPGVDDTLIANQSKSANVVLLTQDRDFGELAFHRGVPVAGVVMMQLERLSLPSQIERVSTFLAAEKDKLIGSFTVLEPASFRRRAL